MNDMHAVIVPKSDQLSADALSAGPKTITITAVSINPGTEQPVSISYDGDTGLVYRPCKSMRRVMVTCWGPDATAYIGRSLTLYNDPKVLWGGMPVGGIRISHMSHLDGAQTMALTAAKGARKPFTVKPLVVAAKKRPPIDIARLRESLAACQTSEEVVAIGRHSRIVTALSTEPDDVRAEINALLAEAMERVQADDGTASNEPADEATA